MESKKTAEDAAKGKMQAKYYADGLEKEHGQRPVIFYTNGYEIFIWDDAKGEPPRSIFGFYSLDSLRYCIFQRNQREAALGALFPKEAIIDRLYQIECVKRTCENFDKRRRHALLIQATGTGKTRVALALSELMIRAKWGKRIRVGNPEVDSGSASPALTGVALFCLGVAVPQLRGILPDRVQEFPWKGSVRLDGHPFHLRPCERIL